MDMVYCSVRDIRNELRADDGTTSAPDDSAIDARMLQFIRQASSRIHKISGRQFSPFYGSKSFRDPPWGYDPNSAVVYLPEPMMSITSVTDVNGNLMVEDTDYFVYDTFGPGIQALQMSPAYSSSAGCGTWITYCPTCPGGWSGPTVVGVWGVHDNYAGAWIPAVATVDATTGLPINLTEPIGTLKVSSIITPDAYGIAPCLSPGMFIRTNTEVMLILTIDLTTKEMRVQRAMNGTSQEAHLVLAPIYTFQTTVDINQAAARFAAYPYKRRGDYTQATFDGVAIQTLPADLPPDVRGALQPYL